MKLRLVLTVAALTCASLPTHAQPGALTISDVRVTPLKTGTRAAVTFRTSAPALGYAVASANDALASASASIGARERQAPGTDHLIVLEPLESGTSYEVTVGARGLDGATAEEVRTTVTAVHGPGAFDAASSTYTLNVLMRFDWDLSSEEMNAWRAHAHEFATRVNDMTDGWIRLGTVILADADARDAVWAPQCRPACPAGADVAIYTGYGYSTYLQTGHRVTLMWQQAMLGGIRSSTSSIEFPRYLICCFGGTPSAPLDMGTQWWTGKRLAHEFGHYAMWLQDQYEPPVCDSSHHDLSIMGADLYRTEIDSADTPCAWQGGGARNSWDQTLIAYYDEIPSRIGPPDPGPHTPGDAFSVVVVDRGVA
ncbi:MAG TPA: fibronectin type III domain-containing protein [Actinomycetota bacterium]|nr:fibronectin type III domain-containing protein [Actinomycetota bacterium]